MQHCHCSVFRPTPEVEKADEGRKGKGGVGRKGGDKEAGTVKKKEIRCPKEEEEREKTGGEKSKACQAGLLVRRAVYV